jgi:hypothetical protein
MRIAQSRAQMISIADELYGFGPGPCQHALMKHHKPLPSQGSKRNLLKTSALGFNKVHGLLTRLMLTADATVAAVNGAIARPNSWAGGNTVGRSA